MSIDLGGQTSASAPTVFVVDDDEDVRDSLHQLLRSAGLRPNVFSHGEALIDELKDRPVKDGPACILLDVRLRGLSGLMVQQELARRGIPHPVIFISGYGDISMTVKAMKAGAVDFLTKPFRHQDVLDAIAEAVHLDRSRRADAQPLQAFEARWLKLTPRKQQVMRRLAGGMVTDQIAVELGLSEVTVKVYRGECMKSLGVKSIAEFADNAKRLGWQMN
ncbi:FixJ family two-component response regulator [Paraburkholderia sp. GAS199]|uniref:response regulator transcription factor n=1 Tax=Paraburkholderia sp. GAS199 TaxID=3035126 RepID=UPI003D1FCFC6